MKGFDFKTKLNKGLDILGNKLDNINIFKIAIVGSIVFTVILTFQKCEIEKKDNIIKDQQETLDALQDSAVSWRDTKGRYLMEIKTLTNTHTSNILKLKSKEEDIQHLQRIINEYAAQLHKPGSSVTVTKPSIKFDSVLKTDERTQETLKDIVVSKYLETKWIKTNFGFSSDSTWISFQTFDRLALINMFDRKNIFSPYQMNTRLVSENPYISYEYLRGWSNVSVPEKRFVFGPAVLVGINKDLKLNYSVGVGLVYKVGSF